jgi:hypothetical protein
VANDAGAKGKGPGRRPGRKAQASAFSSLRAKQIRGSPEAEAAVRMLPPRTYESERGPAPLRDGLGLPVPAAQTIQEERLIEVLRLLGRVYVADAFTLFRTLYYQRFSIKTTYRDLKLLAEQKLVWHAPPPPGLFGTSSVTGANGRLKIYGLSRAGHQVLSNLGVESDERALEMLVARDVKGKIPKPSSLAHDLQVTWWCSSMIEGLRLLPWCTGVFCQVEYNAVKNQRADALLIARFNFMSHRPDPSSIPWFSGTPLRPDEVELRWALELDNSTESVNILVDKFITYRELHATGTYHRILNGDVLLMLVVQNARRAAYLAAEFSRVWPEGWGLVSTPGQKGANSTPFGALWGSYRDMNTQAEVPALSHLTRDAHGRVAEYTPLVPYGLWLAYLEWMKAHQQPPTSMYDLLDETGGIPGA